MCFFINSTKMHVHMFIFSKSSLPIWFSNLISRFFSIFIFYLLSILIVWGIFNNFDIIENMCFFINPPKTHVHMFIFSKCSLPIWFSNLISRFFILRLKIFIFQKFKIFIFYQIYKKTTKPEGEFPKTGCHKKTASKKLQKQLKNKNFDFHCFTSQYAAAGSAI